MNKKKQFVTVGAVTTIVAIGLIYFGLGEYDSLMYDDARMLFRFGVVALVAGLIVATIGATMKKS